MAKLSIEEFIAIWNAAKSVEEFCTKSGYSYSTATSMASRYRTAGKQLKILTEGMAQGGRAKKKHDQ